MPTHSNVERTIIVFCIWASLGFLGAAGLVEGFSRDSLAISLIGLAGLLAAFVAHIILNAVFGQSFTRGEAALGIGAFGLFAFAFIASWFAGILSRADYFTGIAAFAAIGAGFLIYLAARYGTRGAFSQFHIPPAQNNGERR
ncbi:MAG: hypothetical protein QM744_00705 [Mesorhizobium sp.]